MGWDFVENEIETSKNSMDKFLQVKKKEAEFFTFFEVYTVRVFSMVFFLVYGPIFCSAVAHTLQKFRGVAPGLFI